MTHLPIGSPAKHGLRSIAKRMKGYLMGYQERVHHLNHDEAARTSAIV
ncbi:MAG: hypothetical protein HN742_40940 [Lentisphaerae bacterium]|jgi:hypothetical protein|nr:hypothetical protein [Lentisphaerota bacterium]MBT5605157.1 hypothetical protein [Lentisphaerota bacterium]MBT7848303.1 hypothetical protein [Lentisphaerota bacterium]